MQQITRTTRLATRGQTSIVLTPPAPCGLGNCVAELHVTIRHDTTRIHLDEQQRRELILGLGGILPLSAGLPDDALPDVNERASQRGLGR